MSELKGLQGELHAVIEIKRAATGKVERYELIGHSDPERLKELLAEAQSKPLPDQEPSK